MKHLKRIVGALIVTFAVVAPTAAQGGDYSVKACFSGHGYGGSLGVFSSNTSPNKFQKGSNCTDSSFNPHGYDGLGVTPKGTYAIGSGDLGRIKFTAPSGLGFAGVKAKVYEKPESIATDWRVNALMHNNGSNVFTLPLDGVNDLWTDLDETVPGGGVRSDFEVNLKCTGSDCPATTYYYWVLAGSIDLKVRDSTNPNALHGSTGSLYSGGTVSGTKTAVGYGQDLESGTWRVYLVVNNTLTAWSDAPGVASGISCNPLAPTYNAYTPCPYIHEANLTVNTAVAPFVNGANQVKFCALDYSLNSYCEAPTTVNVFN